MEVHSDQLRQIQPSIRLSHGVLLLLLVIRNIFSARLYVPIFKEKLSLGVRLQNLEKDCEHEDEFVSKRE